MILTRSLFFFLLLFLPTSLLPTYPSMITSPHASSNASSSLCLRSSEIEFDRNTTFLWYFSSTEQADAASQSASKSSSLALANADAHRATSSTRTFGTARPSARSENAHSLAIDTSFLAVVIL